MRTQRTVADICEDWGREHSIPIPPRQTSAWDVLWQQYNEAKVVDAFSPGAKRLLLDAARDAYSDRPIRSAII